VEGIAKVDSFGKTLNEQIEALNLKVVYPLMLQVTPLFKVLLGLPYPTRAPPNDHQVWRTLTYYKGVLVVNGFGGY